jgi:hypothetical protein
MKEIHCFGTSHTEGGGFEFQSDSNNIELKKFYNEQPLTKENYSYPGQLQKLIGNDIKVYNHSKSGYGNERMYRLAYDVLNNKTPNKEKLLLLEFSHIGRKEYYSKSINDFFIANYSFNENGSIETLNIAQTYFNPNIEDFQKLLKPSVYAFMKETIDFDIQEKNMKMNNIFFIHYLLNNNINFLLTTPPCFLLPFDLIQKIKNNLIEFEKDVFDIYRFVEKNKLRIMDDTNNQIPDGHSGLEGNKKIAKIIFDKINNTKNII